MTDEELRLYATYREECAALKLLPVDPQTLAWKPIFSAIRRAVLRERDHCAAMARDSDHYSLAGMENVSGDFVRGANEMADFIESRIIARTKGEV